MIKRFLAYYKHHKLIFGLDMTASLFVAVIAVFYPIVTRRMLNNIMGDAPDFKLIVILGCALLGLYFLRMLLNFFIQYYGHVMGVKMQAHMRSDMFKKLESLPYRYYDNHETGKIMSRMTNDLMDISELAHHGPENLIISGISVVTAFAYLSTISLKLTLIIFAAAPLLLIIAASLRKKMRDAFQRSRQSVAEINAALEGSISGIRVTKAFCNSEKENEKFEVGNRAFVRARRDAYKAMGKFHSSTTFVTDVFNVIVLVAGGIFLFRGEINIADYSAFVVSAGMFISPLMTLINFMEMYQNAFTGFERFLELMDEEPESDKDGAVALEVSTGSISLKDVSYSYDEGKEVLDGVSLEIPAGKTVALVGPSGGGKTTICHLIPRFYQLEEGGIAIDGTDIRDVTAESLRKNIGIVQQDVYLFNSTIRENILYGKLDATDEEIYEAARRANIHDYIMSLEKGYETEIGERGVKLSGGQKQRLSIARVFLKNPPILILDEATSALDNATEVLIQEALDELSVGRTTVVVAHRLSTVRNADKIAVISGGRVVEEGTHEELIKKGGEYFKLVEKARS